MLPPNYELWTMNYELTKRLSWLDAMRGFTMILVVAYLVA